MIEFMIIKYNDFFPTDTPNGSTFLERLLSADLRVERPTHGACRG